MFRRGGVPESDVRATAAELGFTDFVVIGKKLASATTVDLPASVELAPASDSTVDVPVPSSGPSIPPDAYASV